MSKEVKIYGNPSPQFKFLKPVGKVDTDGVIPYYGVFEKKELQIKRIPITKSRNLVLDKQTLLFPLYSSEEIHSLNIKDNEIISLKEFLGYVDGSLKKKDFFIELTTEQIKYIYDNHDLLDGVSNYLIDNNKLSLTRTRKKD